MKRLLFGPRREWLTVAPGQGHLFDTEPMTSVPPESAASDPGDPAPAKHRKWSQDGPAEFLKGYAGYLQTDAYASYESAVNASAGKIIDVGCWAHVRGDFFDGRHTQPREVHYVLGLIAQLYDVEDEVRGRSDQERLAARRERSLPVLKRLEEHLREQEGLALPKSQFGKAINYAPKQYRRDEAEAAARARKRPSRYSLNSPLL